MDTYVHCMDDRKRSEMDKMSDLYDMAFEMPVEDASYPMAFQVSEELFQQIKDYLARFAQVYHRKLSQKEFVISLIEQALAEADEEFEAAEATEAEDTTEAVETDDTVDEIEDDSQENEVTDDVEMDEDAQPADAPEDHYHWSRYYALNLHSVFYHGTVEWRCFESTLHAGEVRADITLALAMSAQAITLEKTVARKTPVGDNPAFTFRTFLLRLGLIGPEYKNVRMHLLKRLPGDPAWLRDRNQYESYQRRHNRGGDAR